MRHHGTGKRSRRRETDVGSASQSEGTGTLSIRLRSGFQLRMASDLDRFSRRTAPLSCRPTRATAYVGPTRLWLSQRRTRGPAGWACRQHLKRLESRVQARADRGASAGGSPDFKASGTCYRAELARLDARECRSTTASIQFREYSPFIDLRGVWIPRDSSSANLFLYCFCHLRACS